MSVSIPSDGDCNRPNRCCDNGLCQTQQSVEDDKQKSENQGNAHDIKGYYTNYTGFSHATFDNNKDYQHVNLNQVHSDKVSMPNNVDFITTV